MGLFDFLKFYQQQKDRTQFVRTLSNNYPVFSQFGSDIYASDVVQQALYCIVTELKKLKPRHVRREGFDLAPVYDEIQRALDDPNPLMTRSDFIEKVTWALLLNYNSFIYIERDRSGKVMNFWPLSPTQVTFLESAGRTYIQMLFRNGDEYTFPQNKIIHLKSHYSVNDLMGGDENGEPNNDALLNTLNLNHVLLQGVKKALTSSFAINGVVKYNTLLDDGKMEAAIADFETKLANSSSGFLPMDLKGEIIPFNRTLAMVDEPTLKFIDEKILRHFGVPLAILQGDFTAEQYDAFYQKTLEPLIVTFSEAFTKGVFTQRELGYRNEIIFYPKELIFMSVSQTLEMVGLLGQSGTLYENEKRVAFGLEPLEELRGKRLQSLNYVDVDIAREYQLNMNTTGTQTDDQQSDLKVGTNEDGDWEEGFSLNGSQVKALLEIIEQYKSGLLDKQQSIDIITTSFGLTSEDAERLLGEPPKEPTQEEEPQEEEPTETEGEENGQEDRTPDV